MDEKQFPKYNNNPISVDVLSILDLTKEGKVVSAQAWTDLWNLVLKHTHTVEVYCTEVSELLQHWSEYENILQELATAFNYKFDALAKSFVHYGTEAPTNEHTKIWVQEIDARAADYLISKREFDMTLGEGLSQKQDNLAELTSLRLSIDSVPLGVTCYNVTETISVSYVKTIGGIDTEYTVNYKNQNIVSIPSGSVVTLTHSKLGDVHFISVALNGLWQIQTDAHNTQQLHGGICYVYNVSNSNTGECTFEYYTTVDTSYNPDSERAQSGTAIKEALSNYLTPTSNVEWVFDGGNADNAVEATFVVDGTVSGGSDNAISNRAVAQYIAGIMDNLNADIFNAVDAKLMQELSSIRENLSAINNYLQTEIDFVIEQGTTMIDVPRSDGGIDKVTWHYRKWHSGVGECWTAGVHLLSKFTTTYGTGLYRSDVAFPIIPYPFSLSERGYAPNCQISLAYTAADVGIVYAATQNDMYANTPRMYAWSPVRRDWTVEVTGRAYARGYWK